MNFGLPLKECCQKNKRQRWDICEEFSVWQFVTRSAGLKSVKPGMSNHFSESRDPSYVSSAMCPECPGKDWRSKSFRLQSTPTGKRSKLCPRKRWRDYISDFAWSSWCGDSRTIWDCCWSWGISAPPRASALATLPKGKPGTKMKEWVCRPTLKLSIYENVFSLFAKSECRIQIITHIWTEACVSVNIS